MVMLTKTTIMFELIEDHDNPSSRSCMDTLRYLLVMIPLYTFSAVFRLGTISLSSVFFGYWTVLPILVLVISLVWLGIKNDVVDIIFMIVPANIFVVSLTFSLL